MEISIKSHHRALYFNKFSRSVFRQVSPIGAGHIGFNILYWTSTFNFRTKFEHCPPPPFWSIFAVHVRGHAILLKIEVIFFKFFFQKSILGSPDNTLSNF